MRRLEACQSPVWDTGLAVVALLDAGVAARRPGGRRGRATGCSARRSACAGDWAVRRPGPGTRRLGVRVRQRPLPRHRRHRRGRAGAAPRRARGPAARGRGRPRRRLDASACSARDGGWGAFDADNTRALPTKLPFCDFGAVIDPPSADVTAHVVEMLAAEGPAGSDACRRGVRWLLDAPGAGRLLVRPLGRQPRLRHRRRGARAGRRRASTRDDPAIRRAVALARASTRTPTAAGARTCAPTSTRRGSGAARPTASQTAWALLALLAAGERGRGRRARASLAGRAPSAPTAPGTSRSSPAPASPATSTSTTTCTGWSSRCPRSAATSDGRRDDAARSSVRPRCGSSAPRVRAGRCRACRCVRTGRGPAALPAARVAAGTPARPCWSSGRRRARAPGVRPGDVVVAERGRATGRATSRCRRRRCWPARCAGRGLTRARRAAGRPATAWSTGAAPAAAAPATGALAVDMETAAAGRAARRAAVRGGPGRRRHPRPTRCCRPGTVRPRPGRAALAAAAAPVLAAGRRARRRARSCSPRRGRSAPGWSGRSRSSSGRSTGTAPRSTCAGRSCTTPTSCATWNGAARSSWTSSTRCPAGATVVFSAHGVAPAVRGAGASSAACRHRRDLPAGGEGARRGAPLRPARATRSS